MPLDGCRWLSRSGCFPRPGHGLILVGPTTRRCCAFPGAGATGDEIGSNHDLIRPERWAVSPRAWVCRCVPLRCGYVPVWIGPCGLVVVPLTAR